MMRRFSIPEGRVLIVFEGGSAICSRSAFPEAGSITVTLEGDLEIYGRDGGWLFYHQRGAWTGVGHVAPAASDDEERG